MNIGKETEQIEFKKSTSELKEAIISIVSILNKHTSGTVYFGVNNSGNIVGQPLGSNTVRDVSRRIYESVKPIPEVKIDTLDYGDLKYICVHFQGNQQPYSAYGRYYIRVADEDREMTQEQLKQYFNQIEPTYEVWEKKANGQLNQINETLLERVYTHGISAKRFSEEYSNAKDILNKLNLITDGKVNNAGTYLFSKNKPIKLKLALFATDQKLTFLDQNQFEGNIYECIEEAVLFISKHMRWKAEIGEISRVDIPEIPTRAIREVVINSFAHAKYDSGFMHHEINVFPSKITIFNPGKLSNELNPIMDSKIGSTRSIIKNPLIANVLYRTNMIEAFGTGFTRVFELCDDSGIKYEFENTHHGFEFTFIRTSNVLKELENVLKELNTTEVLVYQLLKNNGNLNSEEIAEQIGKNQKTILRIFVSLQEKGYLKRVGGRKQGYWETLE